MLFISHTTSLCAIHTHSLYVNQNNTARVSSYINSVHVSYTTAVCTSYYIIYVSHNNIGFFSSLLLGMYKSHYFLYKQSVVLYKHVTKTCLFHIATRIACKIHFLTWQLCQISGKQFSHWGCGKRKDRTPGGDWCWQRNLTSRCYPGTPAPHLLPLGLPTYPQGRFHWKISPEIKMLFITLCVHL